MILEIIVKPVVLEILADDNVFAEFLDYFGPDAVIGADVGELLDPIMNGAF